MPAIASARRPEIAPALFRLLSESALSRAALGVCGFPVVLVDASSPAFNVTYVNAAFAGYFGWREPDALGRPLAALLFRGEDTRLRKVLADPDARWQLTAFAKSGEERHVELTLGAVRSAEGKLTHWVLSFSDRSEAERLRGELESARPLAPAACGGVSPPST